MSTAKKIKSNGNGSSNGNGNGHANGHMEAAPIKLKKKKLDEDSKGIVGELTAEVFDMNELLNVLVEVRNGNFNVRMPCGKIGITGKVCDTLNDIIFTNKNPYQKPRE